MPDFGSVFSAWKRPACSGPKPTTGWGTVKPYARTDNTRESKRVAVISIMDRPKAREAKTTRPSRSLPRSREATAAKAEKARIKVASRKDGKGWRASISTIRPVSYTHLRAHETD